jgi:DNA-binding MarR family transcriptional regulator
VRTDTRPGVDQIGAALERLVSWLRRNTPAQGYSLTLRMTVARLAADGPARISDLARLEGVTQPAMTGLVNRLEGEGMVTRRPDPQDARAALVTLTDAGWAFVLERRAERGRFLAVQLERLPDPDRRALEAALPALDRLTGLLD